MFPNVWSHDKLLILLSHLSFGMDKLAQIN